MTAKSLAVLAALALLSAPARPAAGHSTGTRSAARKAFVVGIDRYGGGAGVSTGSRRFGPLQGAVADAEAFAAQLEKLGFAGGVTLLRDEQATRQAILDGIAALAASAQPGDVRVFYFSGHGSRVRNSLSPENDQLDESLLPVDVGSVKNGKEVLDIRDKELARALNEVLDRGAVLTVVNDSCHSGSATRGPRQDLVGVARQAPWDERDVKDGSRPPAPETRGALVLSAAQDEQPAQELGTPARGAFTKALVDALQADGAADLPARALFLRVEDAVRRATRETQDPVLAGTVQRQRSTIFEAGPPKAAAGAVVRVKRQGTELFAESAPLLPLGVGTVLERDAGSRKVRLAVARGYAPEGLVPVTPAERVEGEAPESGTYRIVEWVTPADNVKVHVPAGMSPAQLEVVRKTADVLRRERVALVSDPVDDKPTHRLEALAVGDRVEWLLLGPCVKLDGSARGRDAVALVRKASAAGAAACAQRPAKPTVFVSVPPPRALADRLRASWGREGAAVKLVGSPGDAAYVLAGRLEPQAEAYALVRTASAPGAMPPRTDFVTTAAGSGGVESAHAQLLDLGERLGKSFGWLSLGGSDPVAQAAFAYQLAVRPLDGGALKGDGATTKLGERYGLVLRRSPAATAVPRRYVYVFSMDSQGRRQLVFPNPNFGEVENRYPLEEGSSAPEQIVLLDYAFEVGPPYGTDTMFLFATATKLFDPRALEDEGVRTRGRTDQVGDAEDLLRGIATRGGTPVVPQQWTLKKLSLTSVER